MCSMRQARLANFVFARYPVARAFVFAGRTKPHEDHKLIVRCVYPLLMVLPQNEACLSGQGDTISPE